MTEKIVPGYAAVVNSDTIILVAEELMQTARLIENPGLFRALRAAIEAEQPLEDVKAILSSHD